jgi:hypothetical protein
LTAADVSGLGTTDMKTNKADRIAGGLFLTYIGNPFSPNGDLTATDI